MITFLIIGVYVLGWLWSSVPIARAIKESSAHFASGTSWSREDDALTLAVGVVAAILWPFIVPFWAWKVFSGERESLVAKIMTTDTERRAAEQRELAAWRRWADQEGLPYPEVDSRG